MIDRIVHRSMFVRHGSSHCGICGMQSNSQMVTMKILPTQSTTCICIRINVTCTLSEIHQIVSFMFPRKLEDQTITFN